MWENMMNQVKRNRNKEKKKNGEKEGSDWKQIWEKEGIMYKGKERKIQRKILEECTDYSNMKINKERKKKYFTRISR